MQENVLVTGAAKGIGERIAQTFFEAGYHVVGVDKEPIESTENDWTRGTLQVDISVDPAQIAHDYLGKYGCPDIVVHNAAENDTLDFGSSDMGSLKHVWETNFFAPFVMSQIFADHMITNHIAGRFIFVGSLHDKRIRKHIAYSTSKAAVSMLMKEMADDLAEHGIRVNMVSPGAVRNTSGDQDHERQSSRLVPLGRLADPQEIAQAILFLADNDKASYITGANLVVDGGLQHHNWLHTLYGESHPQ